MDDEYDNLVGLFSSTSRHAASTVQHIFVWACEGVCVCVCVCVGGREGENKREHVCVCVIVGKVTAHLSSIPHPLKVGSFVLV